MKRMIFTVGSSLLAMQVVAGVNEVASYRDVRLRGPYAAKLDRLLENQVWRTDAIYLARAFRRHHAVPGSWATEFWGKFMHSAVPFSAYRFNSAFLRNIDEGVDAILSVQEDSGYIGNYSDKVRLDEGWDIWGVKYTLMGLLHYYDGCMCGEGDPEDRSRRKDRAILAARRLCDYLIREVGPNGRRNKELHQTGEWSGAPSCSVLEPVVWLYKRTNEEKYLEFATHIVRQLSESEKGPRLVDLALRGVPVSERNGFGVDPDRGGGYVVKNNRLKAYEMMSCYQGLIEYWEVTGREDCLKAALAAADSIARDEITLAGSGSSSEIWYRGKLRQHLPFMKLQETCVTTTWMRFAEKLLTVTGDPRWADELERSFYNAYLAAINPAYTEFCSYTPMNGYRMRGGDSCQMHVNCCSMNGPRGYLSFLRGCVQANADRVFYNFYASGSQRIKLPSANAYVEFDSFTYYPREGEVTIAYTGESDMDFTLALRIPRWSASTSVSVNGREMNSPRPGSYFDIRRRWMNGDEIKLTLDLSVRSHIQDGHVAFTRGPVLLARDSRFCDGRVDEVIPPASWAFSEPEVFKTPEFEAIYPTFEGIDMAFATEMTMGDHPKRRKLSVHFCDFASAGNTWRPDNVYCTWLPFERIPTETQLEMTLDRTEKKGK